MPPKKINGKQKGKGGKPAGGEGPTPQYCLDNYERTLKVARVKPASIPAGSKRDEFHDSSRMKRLRLLPTIRHLAPRDTTLLRNDDTHYKEANSGYMRGVEAATPCAQCENKNGTQEKCVIVNGEMAGACTNCWYDKDGKKCTFRQHSAASKETKAGKSKKVEILEDDEDEVEDDEDEEEQERHEEMDGPVHWNKAEDDNDGDDAAGGDDGDAGALLAGHAITAY